MVLPLQLRWRMSDILMMQRRGGKFLHGQNARGSRITPRSSPVRHGLWHSLMDSVCTGPDSGTINCAVSKAAQPPPFFAVTALNCFENSYLSPRKRQSRLDLVRVP